VYSELKLNWSGGFHGLPSGGNIMGESSWKEEGKKKTVSKRR